MPLISVILPVFNAGNTISRAIESILNQSFSDFELIIINNNCTDNTGDIIDAYKKQDGRITITNEAKQGVMYAANNGIEHAKCTYIARCDADDISFPKRLEKQLRFLEKHEYYDVVSGRVQLGGDMNNNKGFERYVAWLNDVKTYEQIILNRFVECPIVNPSVLMRKTVFEKCGLFSDNGMPEDYEFWLRVIDAGLKIGKIDDYVIQWNDSPTRLTRTDIRYSYEAFYRAKSHYLAKWLRSQSSKKLFIWGAGRLSRKRVALLIEAGISIHGYIDVVANKQLHEKVYHYEDFKYTKDVFILSYVANTGAREKIRSYLMGKKLTEGIDFLLIA